MRTLVAFLWAGCCASAAMAAIVGPAVDAQGFDLHWYANPVGRKPVAYLVYGSDERGFTASDVPYRVVRGKGFVRSVLDPA